MAEEKGKAGSAGPPKIHLTDTEVEVIMNWQTIMFIVRIIYVIVKALVGMDKDEVNGDLTPK